VNGSIFKLFGFNTDRVVSISIRVVILMTLFYLGTFNSVGSFTHIVRRLIVLLYHRTAGDIFDVLDNTSRTRSGDGRTVNCT
jgi:hypothetical protein